VNGNQIVRFQAMTKSQFIFAVLFREAMNQYLRPVFMLLFQRLTSSKTVKFVKCLLVYFCSFVNKYGAAAFIEMIDTIEPKFMGKVVDRLFIADLQKISGPTDKRICSVGVTRILCEAPQYMLNGDYAVYWLVFVLIKIFQTLLTTIHQHK